MTSITPDPASTPRAEDVDILMTASEAYPALERLFLDARHEVVAGFRVFDPKTPLLSDRACERGDTWLDLVVDTLDRGVPVTLTLSGFDPVMAYRMHQRAWYHLRLWVAANELARRGSARLGVHVLRHPAQGGILPRIAFAPRTRRTLGEVVGALPLSGAERRATVETSPGLRTMIAEGRDGAVSMRRWAVPPLYPVTLHHKLAVFDGSTTYVGGLDLNERRFDDPGHDKPSQGTWHDLQLVVRNADVAADAVRFLRDMADVTAARARSAPFASAFLATVSRKRENPVVALRPRRHVTSIFDATIAAIGSATDFIYLETQYFRDRRVAAALAEAGRRNPRMRCLLLVPAAPDDVAFRGNTGLDARFGEYLQVSAIRKVRRAFGDRFFVSSPAQPRATGPQDDPSPRASLAGAPIIYVHSKVSIFDGHRAIVSSANLNGRSMSWDSEAGVDLRDAGVVAALKDRVVGHWMATDGVPLSPLPDPPELFAKWRARARGNAALPPAERQGFLLPYDLSDAAETATPLPGAPQEMV